MHLKSYLQNIRPFFFPCLMWPLLVLLASWGASSSSPRDMDSHQMLPHYSRQRAGLGCAQARWAAGAAASSVVAAAGADAGGAPESPRICKIVANNSDYETVFKRFQAK